MPTNPKTKSKQLKKNATKPKKRKKPGAAIKKRSTKATRREKQQKQLVRLSKQRKKNSTKPKKRKKPAAAIKKRSTKATRREKQRKQLVRLSKKTVGVVAKAVDVPVRSTDTKASLVRKILSSKTTKILTGGVITAFALGFGAYKNLDNLKKFERKIRRVKKKQAIIKSIKNCNEFKVGDKVQNSTGDIGIVMLDGRVGSDMVNVTFKKESDFYTLFLKCENLKLI
jgi:hypothetical protein